MAFVDPRREGATHKRFSGCSTNTLTNVCIMPVNAGRKPGHQMRMRPQSKPSVVFDRIRSAPTISPTLVASVPSLSSSPPISVPASTVSLSSPVTSTLASSQASSSQCISLEDPRRGRETIFEFHLISELPKKISRCCGNCHETITQSLRPFVSEFVWH